MSNRRIDRKIIKALFLLVFFFTDICCMDLHLTSWKDVRYNSSLYPMHREIAELAAKARYKIKGPTDSSNISIIGITVRASDGSRHFAHFGILSSALNSDESKSEAVDTVQVVTVPEMLRGEPAFAAMGTDSSEVTRTHKLKAVLSYVGEDHKMHAKMAAIRQAIDAKITLNQKLDVVGTIRRIASL